MKMMVSLQIRILISLSSIYTLTEIRFPTKIKEFQTLLKVIISITSFLSVLGSMAIIVTYLFLKEMMARHTFLIYLSIADLFITLSSLLGILTQVSSLDSSKHRSTISSSTNSALGNWYKVQVAVQVFETESSILWTMGVAVNMFALAVVKPKVYRWGIKLVVVLHLVFWVIPFILTLWLLLAGFLWYDSDATPGFCAIVGRSTHHNSTMDIDQSQQYPIIVGYEMWLYLAFIVLLVLYITLSCYICKKVGCYDALMTK